MATSTRQNERAPKSRRPLRELWKSTKMTPVEKVMLWLGWVPADITRHLSCAWCAKEFTFTSNVKDDSPHYCSTNHQAAASAARRKRREAFEKSQVKAKPKAEKPKVSAPPPQPAPKIQIVEIEPARPQAVCHCRNHMGNPKVQYSSNGAAAMGLMGRHLKHGPHRIYQCPTTDKWHITSQVNRRAS